MSANNCNRDAQPALPPAPGSEFAVSFRCKPGNHWRSCTDTVTAAAPDAAAAIIAATDYGMETTGPYTPNAELRRGDPPPLPPASGSHSESP